jgi:hypothetical protein
MKTFKFTTGDSRSLAIHLIVNGRRVRVHIEPPVAYGFIDKAYYITNDEKIAEALKKHPNYGFLFHLESEVDDTPKVTEVVVVKPEDLLVDPVNVIFEETVTSKAKAVAYIQGMYDESFSNTTSIEEMKKEAARRWNIIFVNWK